MLHDVKIGSIINHTPTPMAKVLLQPAGIPWDGDAALSLIVPSEAAPEICMSAGKDVYAELHDVLCGIASDRSRVPLLRCKTARITAQD